MKTFKITFLSVCMVALVGCLDNNTGTKPVVDPVGYSEYYIVNQSGKDLNAAYDLNTEYKGTPIDKDSTVSVPADSSSKLFKLGGIGGYFPPSRTFAKLSFYNLSDSDMKSPLLTIDPIVDEHWKPSRANSNTVKFELVITQNDLE
jgi:hypothetical protein